MLTEIDVAATLKAKLGVERAPMKILGACNPTFAHQALELYPTVRLLLPCNLTVESVDGGTRVIAFNPLGWLDDPLLNTFIHHGNVAMARLMFHELAHQQVYVKDDSGFNEAFATAVELEGTRQWLAQFGTQAQQQQMQQTQQRQKHFQQWLLGYRQQLQQLYASSITDIEKRAAKARLMQALAADYRKMQQQWQGYAGYEHWFQPLPNNAHFASLATYHQWVPAFHHLFEEHAGDWAGFYQSVRKLAKMPREQRQQRLMQLQQRGKSDNGGI